MVPVPTARQAHGIERVVKDINHIGPVVLAIYYYPHLVGVLGAIYMSRIAECGCGSIAKIPKVSRPGGLIGIENYAVAHHVYACIGYHREGRQRCGAFLPAAGRYQATKHDSNNKISFRQEWFYERHSVKCGTIKVVIYSGMWLAQYRLCTVLSSSCG